jgi:hypothetical protein
MKTYKQLCEENKKLFEKMELCTMLMGKALVEGDTDENYELYLIKREELKRMIDENIDLMDNTVYTTEKKRFTDRRFRNNSMKMKANIVKMFYRNPGITTVKIAEKYRLPEEKVSAIITNYICEKRIA